MTGVLGNASPTTRRRVLWISAPVFLVLFAFLAYQDMEMQDTGGPGMIPFEVAGSTERAEEILAEWGDEGEDAARASLIADFPYLVAYAVFLAVACTAVAPRFARRGLDGLARLGGYMSWGMLLVGLFDALENAALLVVLADNTEVFPRLAQIASILKFALAAAGLLYIVAGLVVGRGREPNQPEQMGAGRTVRR